MIEIATITVLWVLGIGLIFGGAIAFGWLGWRDWRGRCFLLVCSGAGLLVIAINVVLILNLP